ncbi:hypothetical protein HY522_02920 [bacterium]|nr:hypothetical protein [bacterium]
MSLMGLFGGLFQGGNAGGVVKAIGDVIDKFVETADEKRAADMVKAKLRMQEMTLQHEFELAVREHDIEVTKVAGENIRAETMSGDKFTSRARPLFLYICNFILLWNYVVVPLLGRTPIEFPEPMCRLFGSVMLGYVGARTWEKAQIFGKASASEP